MVDYSKYGSWIKAVYLGGSSANPYIPNPHDKDYIFIVENEKDDRITDLFSKRGAGECFMVREDGKRYIPCPWSYSHHFSKLIWGIECGENYDIFKCANDYKKCLVDAGYKKDYTPERKIWYHILIGIYFLENGDYTLTDYQAEQVRLCHDKKMDYGIYRFIQSKLELWK